MSMSRSEAPLVCKLHTAAGVGVLQFRYRINAWKPAKSDTDSANEARLLRTRTCNCMGLKKRVRVHNGKLVPVPQMPAAQAKGDCGALDIGDGDMMAA